MKKYRSALFQERHMAGARALWNATGHFENSKPIIAIANSFTEFVPGHVHLNKISKIIAQSIVESGGIAKEFNTIGIDDGIAMGHDGMLYSLPSRDLIADSIEYSVNAHRADAMICITNCDKITPAMLMASMRLNIPTIVISGGPMEAGKVIVDGKEKAIDLVDVIIAAGDENISEKELQDYEENGCPSCGSCSGLFTANSMNCLSEALGLSLVGNGTLLATHQSRKELFHLAGKQIVDITKQYYEHDNDNVLPRNIANYQAFINAMAVDIAMGGSTNTILHMLAIANEANIKLKLEDIDELSKKIPNICKIAPSSQYHMEDFHNSGGVMAVMGELLKNNLIDKNTHTIYGKTIEKVITKWDINNNPNSEVQQFYKASSSQRKGTPALSNNNYLPELQNDLINGCIRNIHNAYSQDGGLAILKGNLAEQGSVIKTAGVHDDIKVFKGKALVCESQEEANAKILGEAKAGDVIVIRYEGPKGGPGMQEMLYPTSYLYSRKLEQSCALITDGRFSGGSSGLVIGHVSPEAAEGGLIALIEDGDDIEINIQQRTINLKVAPNIIEQRRLQQISRNDLAFTPKKNRPRNVSNALKIYAKHVQNASSGAVRKI